MNLIKLLFKYLFLIVFTAFEMIGEIFLFIVKAIKTGLEKTNK